MDANTIEIMEQNYNFPLETEIKCTYETYREASKTYKKSQKKYWAIIYILVALLIVGGVFLLIAGSNSFIATVSITLGVIYLPLVQFIYSLKLKKAFKTNIAMQDATIRYSFYEDELELTTPDASSKMKYEKMYSTLEDANCILLLVSARQYFIIKKENCSEELLEFLHVKMDEINARKNKR